MFPLVRTIIYAPQCAPPNIPAPIYTPLCMRRHLHGVVYAPPSTCTHIRASIYAPPYMCPYLHAPIYVPPFAHPHICPHIFFHQIGQMRRGRGLEGKFVSDLHTDFGNARVSIRVATVGWTMGSRRVMASLLDHTYVVCWVVVYGGGLVWFSHVAQNEDGR